MEEEAPGWTMQRSPEALFRRFEFSSYQETRAFLDRIAQLIEEYGFSPQNISFGTTYANITIVAQGDRLGEREHQLARSITNAANQ